LKNVPIEAPPEAGGHPALEVGLILRRTDAHPDVAEHAPDRLDDAQVAERVGGAQRVVVELAVIEDAALAGPHHEVLVGQDLVPQRLDLGHLGEEAVPADIEAPAVAHLGAGDATDDVVGLLEDRRGNAVLVQLEGGGEAGRAGADHDHLAGIGADQLGSGGIEGGAGVVHGAWGPRKWLSASMGRGGVGSNGPVGWPSGRRPGAVDAAIRMTEPPKC
jgi:hypothetical protein